MGYVYKITNTVNQKSYIGISIHEPNKRKGRIEDHLSGRGNRLLNYAVKKYDRESFCYEILESNVFPEMLADLEKAYIKKFNTVVPNGYNLTHGGDNPILSEESRQNIIKANKRRIGTKFSEEHRRKISNALRGRSLSDETREKISLAKKSKPSKRGNYTPSDETREKISLAKKGKSLSLSQEQRDNISKRFKGKTPWNRGVPAYNRSPFYTSAFDLFASLPPDMNISEKRNIIKKAYPEVDRKRIEHWVREWSGVITPLSSPQHPKYHEVHDEYVSLSSILSIQQKRKHLYTKFSEIRQSTIWRWVQKWQSES